MIATELCADCVLAGEWKEANRYGAVQQKVQAQLAFAKSVELVQSIAANMDNDELRTGFLQAYSDLEIV